MSLIRMTIEKQVQVNHPPRTYKKKTDVLIPRGKFCKCISCGQWHWEFMECIYNEKPL